MPRCIWNLLYFNRTLARRRQDGVVVQTVLGLINVGIQLTPRPNPIFSLLNPPPRPAPPIPPRWKTPSPKRHRAPPPPLTQIICESD